MANFGSDGEGVVATQKAVGAKAYQTTCLRQYQFLDVYTLISQIRTWEELTRKPFMSIDIKVSNAIFAAIAEKMTFETWG